MSSLRDSRICSTSPDFRAGLSYPAATRLEFWWCLLHRLGLLLVLTHTLKPRHLQGDGTAEAVLFPKPIYEMAFSVDVTVASSRLARPRRALQLGKNGFQVRRDSLNSLCF